RYEAFGWSSTPQKIAFNNIDNRNGNILSDIHSYLIYRLALVVGPSLSAANLPSPGKLMTKTNEVQRYNFVDDANTSAPPRILRTPMSASQAGKKSVNEMYAKRTSSSIEQLLIGAKQTVESQKHLSSLRGLGHVVTALMERLQKATPTALPEVAALTQDALAYLQQLSEQLENTKLLFSFGQWLQGEEANKVHYDAAALARRFNQHPPMILAAICECAQLPSIVPVPPTGMDLWRSLFTRTTPVDVSSAILLYVALEMFATSVKPKTVLTFSQLKTSAHRFSRAFNLAPLWEKMIVGLWCIQYNLYTTEALALLQPTIHLDRSILLAVVHVCLQYQKPAVAWELWSTTPPSEEAVDLLLEMHLAMKQYEGAWKLVRAFPEQNAERIPKLLAWHASQTEGASLHQWVLRMTWSPAELPLVHSFLLQDERHHELLVLLYLARCEYDQAYALAQALPAIASSTSLQSLLKAVQLNQETLTSVVPSHTRPHADTSDASSYAPGLYSGRHKTVKITSAPPAARALDLDSPDKSTPAKTPSIPLWTKPGKGISTQITFIK
ncbi:hypothetical protein THRCLA_00282, partial [Thraustotheca clavata]